MKAARILTTLLTVLTMAWLGTTPARAVVTVDTPEGNTFRFGGIDWLGLEVLLFIPDKGRVWVAIPKNHDLDTGPIELRLALDSAGDLMPETGQRPSLRSLQAQIDEMRHNPSIAMKPSQPFLGEVRLFAGNRMPPGWVHCDGRLLAIRSNQRLFEVVGNTYGGDGRNTLGIPDLRGRLPMGVGAGPGLTDRTIGEEPGLEKITLATSQLPSHGHPLRASNSAATITQPAGNVLATATTAQYRNSSTSVVMGTDSIGSTGNSDPVTIIPPSTVLTFGIAINANYARPRLPDAANWPVEAGATAGRWPVEDVSVSHAVRLEPAQAYPWDGRLELFTAGSIDYAGLELVEHEDGVGTIWVAVPRDHDLTASSEPLALVLNPGPGELAGGDGRSTVSVNRQLEPLYQVMADFGLGGWGQGLEFNYGTPDGVIPPPATKVDDHAGMQFTSGGVDYLGLEMIEHEAGIGTIWVAIEKAHDLEVGPLPLRIVLAPDMVTPAD